MRRSSLFIFVVTLSTVLFCGFTVGAQEENKTDDRGRKQGEWIKRYKSGSIEYKGTFKDDKPVGKFEYFGPKGKKSAEVYFREDGSAQAEMFYENGQTAAKGAYAEQESKTGKWTFYDQHGNIRSEIHYKDNKKHGPAVYYYEGGQIIKETAYDEGRENGHRKEYYPDGTPKFDGKVVDGNFEGEIKIYHPNGKINQKGVYRNAVRDGIWVEYSDRGIALKKMVYDKGKLVETEELNTDKR